MYGWRNSIGLSFLRCRLFFYPRNLGRWRDNFEILNCKTVMQIERDRQIADLIGVDRPAAIENLLQGQAYRARRINLVLLVRQRKLDRRDFVRREPLIVLVN